MGAKYDRIGLNYADLRKPDARIAAVIHGALGQAETVLNVGAGAGSYEPEGRVVTAVEPSAEMIRQRRQDAARVVQGSAEALPFDDDSFDACMAVLTVHHWSDQPRGMAEMRRVTRGPVVILTYDPGFRDFWLFDYLPELVTLDEAQMPRMRDYADWLGPVDIAPVEVPHDCTDGFLSAYWRRPEAYLDPAVRKAISPFWALGDISAALARLEGDLASGVWMARYGAVMEMARRDMGYRLVTTRG